MNATLTGKATVQGISGTATYPAIVANGALDVISADATDTADVLERRDGNARLRGFAVRETGKELTLTCLCSVSSGASYADAKKAVIAPTVPSVVTVAGFDEAAAAAINGTYVYKGGATFAYSDDFVRMTLPLMKVSHETAANLCAAVTA